MSTTLISLVAITGVWAVYQGPFEETLSDNRNVRAWRSCRMLEQLRRFL